MQRLVDLLFLLMLWLGIYWKLPPCGWVTQTKREGVFCHGEGYHFTPWKTLGFGLR